jgi:hypothetical protein
MVKITEGWITVQDGTKLYTKTWEVSQSRDLHYVFQVSITHHLLPSVPLLQSTFFLEIQ